jgi:hypothetical protein
MTPNALLIKHSLALCLLIVKRKETLRVVPVGLRSIGSI